jgi:hypothetical protein
MKKCLLLVLGWITLCQPGVRHCGAEPIAAQRGAAVKPDDGLIFDLDFNAIKDDVAADRSASRCQGKLVGAEVCQGVDGYGVRLPGGHACVGVDLPEADRRLDAFSLDLWVSPEEAAHQEVVTAASRGSDFDDLPIMLRWRQGWQMWLSVQTADNQRRCMACDKRCLPPRPLLVPRGVDLRRPDLGRLHQRPAVPVANLARQESGDADRVSRQAGRARRAVPRRSR